MRETMDDPEAFDVTLSERLRLFFDTVEFMDSWRRKGCADGRCDTMREGAATVLGITETAALTGVVVLLLNEVTGATGEVTGDGEAFDTFDLLVAGDVLGGAVFERSSCNASKLLRSGDVLLPFPSTASSELRRAGTALLAAPGAVSSELRRRILLASSSTASSELCRIVGDLLASLDARSSLELRLMFSAEFSAFSSDPSALRRV